VLQGLADKGNTVIVIEHNLDVIKTADWVIDMGPEGGSGGGQIVATGTPEEVAAVPASHTGLFLKNVVDPAPAVRGARKAPAAKTQARKAPARKAPAAASAGRRRKAG
jgi:excinuclease ABC subunit A